MRLIFIPFGILPCGLLLEVLAEDINLRELFANRARVRRCGVRGRCEMFGAWAGLLLVASGERLEDWQTAF